jgi:hypothetical protein
VYKSSPFGTLSPDRRWWWDGTQWQRVPVRQPLVLAGSLALALALCDLLQWVGAMLTFTGLTEAILALPRLLLIIPVLSYVRRVFHERFGSAWLSRLILALVITGALWSLTGVLLGISTYSPQQQGELPPTPIPLFVLLAFTSITFAGTATAVAVLLFTRKAIGGLVAAYAVLTLIAGLCFLTILGSAFGLLFEAIAAVLLGILFLTRRVIGSSGRAGTPTPVGFLSPDGRWGWDGFRWQPAQIREKTQDELVKSAAYAAFGGVGMFFLNQVVLFIIFTALLTNPSNNYMRPAFQTTDGLTLAVAWSLLSVVAIGLFRLQRPPSALSKVVLAIAGLGITLPVLHHLTVAVTADSGAYLFFPQEALVAGLLVAPWLIVVNASLLRRMILSKPLSIIGMAFGAAAAIDSMSGLFTLGRLGQIGHLAGVLGFILWMIWLGVALLRPLPVTAVPVNVTTDEQAATHPLAPQTEMAPHEVEPPGARGLQDPHGSGGAWRVP